MKKTKIKGLNTPNVIVGFRGFWDARISKTAVVDPDSGLLVSGYITEKLSRLHAYEAEKVDDLENEVKAVRTEASDLVTEYSQIQRGLEPLPAVPDPGDVNRVRQYQQAEARRQEATTRLYEIESRLMEINNKLTDREHHVLQELSRVMGLMRSKFSAYGHGMMLRPVSEQMIPEPTLTGALAVYHDIHKQQDACIQKILQEVYHA